MDSFGCYLRAWSFAHPDDARGLTYLGILQGDDEMVEKAAALGGAWAMAHMSLRSFTLCEEGRFRLAWASAEKGDAEGTYFLAGFFLKGMFFARRTKVLQWN